ncbi:solute carrier family 25 member 35-like isoform X1 [Polypterus senegalus]|uniref:solute carrier family 25 member 35-like isoform X1 n=1 Tax=Polypterus senegalus TaxID=55291 RepID=UPI00196286A4|nr:solute carrier family 25 member 35-like isoform X1 [Polypterus senegalus]
MDFVLSGVAACGACLFTNPLEVVKTRMQLQGEMKTPGSYKIHYRNVFHAFYTIGKVDGLGGLQKGLVPALNYQFVMNGVRLGSYAILESGSYIHSEGRVSPVKSVAAGAVAGVLGAVIGSPMYLVKTHLQSQSTASIAVGHQYQHQVSRRRQPVHIMYGC